MLHHYLGTPHNSRPMCHIQNDKLGAYEKELAQIGISSYMSVWESRLARRIVGADDCAERLSAARSAVDRGMT